MSLSTMAAVAGGLTFVAMAAGQLACVALAAFQGRLWPVAVAWGFVALAALLRWLGH